MMDRLSGQLDEHDVFFDLEIEPGHNFVKKVDRELDSCAVMIVLIGRDWLTSTDNYGNRRLDDPTDLVRHEITRALERDMFVLPVLVRDARMPRASELPAPLAPLSDLNAVEIQPRTRDHDYGVLVAVLRRELGLPPGPGAISVSPPARPTGPAPDRDPPAGPRRRRAAGAGVSLSKVPLPVRIGGIAALLFAGLVVAVGQGDSAPSPVRIGAIYSLHGKAADAGRQSLRGVNLAIDYINDGGYPDLGLGLGPGGGLPGLGGAKLTLAAQDPRGDRCKAQPAFDALAKGKVAGVLGAYESTVTLQAIFAANRLEVPIVNDSATAPSLTDPDAHTGPARKPCGKLQADPTPSPWFFRVGPTDSQFAELFAQFLHEQSARGISIGRVAILHESGNIFGEGGASVIADVVRRLGIDVTLYPYHATSAANDSPGPGCRRRALVADMREQIGAIKARPPDAVFALSYLADAVVAVQTMRKLRYVPKALLAFGAGFNDPAFLTQVRKADHACHLPAADPGGIITRAAGGAQIGLPVAQKAGAFFKQRYHETMDDTAARSFTATMTLAQAINAARSTEPRKVRDALRELRVPVEKSILPGDGIFFDPSGQNLRAGGVLLQVVDGAYASIYPPELATVKPSWPLSSAPG